MAIRVLTPTFIVLLSLGHLTVFGQQDHAPFASYDCRYYMADIEIPVDPIPQSELDSLEIPDELVAEWQEEEILTEEWQHWSTAQNFTFGRDRGNMPMINDLRALHPFVRDRVLLLIQLCRKKGIELEVVETYRTPAKQQEYASLGKKYTRSGAGKSKHQYGMAVDVVPVIDSVAQWDDKVLWRKIGLIGERLGLRWGGRWRTLYDPGHFEWTGGLTSVDLGKGKLPEVPNRTMRYPCLEEDLQRLQKYWLEWTTGQEVIARK